MRNALLWVRWTAINSAVALALYYAVMGEQGIANVYITFTWFVGVLTMARLVDKAGASEALKKHPVPRWLDELYDMSTLAALVYFGWWFTALAVFLHFLALSIIREYEPPVADLERLKRYALMYPALLPEAIALLQSGYAIAQRDGVNTDWEAFMREQRKLIELGGLRTGPADNEFWLPGHEPVDVK